MKVYRITKRRDGNEHDGFLYSTSKNAALRLQHMANQEFPENDDKVLEIEFRLTKHAVCGLLNRFASYPDNG
jgi:hypothetical protein